MRCFSCDHDIPDGQEVEDDATGRFYCVTCIGAVDEIIYDDSVGEKVIDYEVSLIIPVLI